MATGTAGAQAINLAFSPILTRIYGPEAFGVLGTFLAILGILVPLAALSYPIAIVLPKRDEDAVGLVKLSLALAVITSLIAMLILVAFKQPIIELFSLQSLDFLILLLPFAMLFSVAWAVAAQWAIRKKLFKLKAQVAISQSLIVNITKSGLGLINPIAAVLVVIASMTNLLHALLYWIGIRKSSAQPVKDGEGAVNARDLSARYKDFAFFRTPQLLINGMGQSLPVLMLASLFGPAAAGFYALSLSVLAVPSKLIGQSVADVFYPKIAETAHAGGNCKGLLIKACGSLMVVGAAPYLLVIVAGPWLYSLVFGAEWLVAGEYARWMSLWLFAMLVTRPVISAIPVLSLQGFFLIFEVVALIVRVSALYVGYLLGDSAIAAVLLFSLSNFVLYALLSCYVIYRA